MEKEDFLKPVPDAEKAGWKLETKSKERFETGTWKDLEVLLLRAKQERLGFEVAYGQGPEGYVING